MAFARTETAILNHPKIVGLDPAAIGLWTLGNAYCWDQLTDGFISDAALTRLLSWVPRHRVRVLANVLVNATCGGRYQHGLWERISGGFVVHDWLDHNPRKEQIVAEREAAKVRMRQRRQASRSHERTGERSVERATEHTPSSPARSRQEVRSKNKNNPPTPLVDSHGNGSPVTPAWGDPPRREPFHPAGWVDPHDSLNLNIPD